VKVGGACQLKDFDAFRPSALWSPKRLGSLLSELSQKQKHETDLYLLIPNDFKEFLALKIKVKYHKAESIFVPNWMLRKENYRNWFVEIY
jgi:hypothetical protein